MKKTNSNLIGINMIFVVALVISNVVTAKLFATGITLLGAPLILPGAALCYAITFLATDIIGEIWGKEEANRTVRWGFIGQIVATLLIILTQKLPAADMNAQLAYDKLLGQNWIFVIGSMVAYFTSQSWDVFFFHKIRNKYIQKYNTTAGGRWLWNNGSTMTSQILDTVIFIGISFGIGFHMPIQDLIRMMIGQYTLKFILALCDTPFFYFFTRKTILD